MRGQRGVTLLELLIVLMVAGLMVGLVYPAIGSGLDSLRLRSAADAISALFLQAMTHVERTQAPVELVVDRSRGHILARALRPGFLRELHLDSGLAIRAVLPPLPAAGEETLRSILLVPGEPFPAIAVVVGNTRGQQRLVRIDPLTSSAIVETPAGSVSENGTR